MKWNNCLRFSNCLSHEVFLDSLIAMYMWVLRTCLSQHQVISDLVVLNNCMTSAATALCFLSHYEQIKFQCRLSTKRITRIGKIILKLNNCLCFSIFRLTYIFWTIKVNNHGGASYMNVTGPISTSNLWLCHLLTILQL